MYKLWEWGGWGGGGEGRRGEGGERGWGQAERGVEWWVRVGGGEVGEGGEQEGRGGRGHPMNKII